MPNVELLQRVMQHVEDNPHSLMSWHWFCGTSACYGGWTCLLSGYQREFGFSTYVTGENGSENAREVAKRLLGITEDQATILFNGGNGINALRHIVKDLVNGAPLLSAEEYWDLDHSW